MAKLFWCLIVFGLLMPSTALCEDLYLLEIKSSEGLLLTEENINHAYGMIDNKFIVFLDKNQAGMIQSSGVQLELLVKDCRPEDYYIVKKKSKISTQTVLSLSPVYSTSSGFLMKIEKSSRDILERDGYMTLPLADKKTPFFYKPPMYALPSQIDYPTDTLADLVSQDSIYSYISRLEAFYTRATPSDSVLKARDWLVGKFLEFGYTDVTTHGFIANSDWQNVINVPAYNVLCRKVGTEQPDQWIVIGGHYDSFTYESVDNPNAPAPGADDDATGVALTLELARVLKDIPTRKSYMFVPFGAEEQGLHGADTLARTLYEDLVNVEFMLNTDMIGWEEDAIYQYHVGANTDYGYRNIFGDAGQRVSGLIPMYELGAYWDDAPFSNYGSHTVCLFEGDHPHPNIHTAYDLCATLNFDYITKIIRSAVASIAVIDAAVDPVECALYDIGDGQSLRISWDSCFSNYSYSVIYGTAPDNLTDTVEIPPLTCFYDISGLTEGVECFAGVMNIPDAGYWPVGIPIHSETPLSIPRTPEALTATPELNSIALDWQANFELDFSHYKIIRKQAGLGNDWELLESNWIDTYYNDSAVIPQTEYFYKLLAVDNVLNESDTTGAVRAYPATFNAGVLIVDETQTCGDIPTEQDQLLFFSNIFGEVDFDFERVDSSEDALSRSVVGQYNPMFWIDDDNCVQSLEGSLDSLAWYFEYDTDFFLAGWRSIYDFTGTRFFYEGSFYYDNFGISYINESPIPDFIGANGQEGWPDLEIRPDAPNSGRLEDISIFEVSPQAEVIYRFNSNTSHQYFDNKPVGVALDTHNGKRVVLSFPLYFLTEESAQALITKTFEYFAEESVLYGDVNGDWSVNIFDVTHIISYLYLGGPPPQIMNNGDVNGDCTINIFDVTFYISYLYLNGPEPMEGCVE